MITMFYNNSSCLCVLYALYVEGSDPNIFDGYISIPENDFCKKTGTYNTYNAHRDRTLFYIIGDMQVIKQWPNTFGLASQNIAYAYTMSHAMRPHNGLFIPIKIMHRRWNI
jgi:hypothetical protein